MSNIYKEIYEFFRGNMRIKVYHPVKDDSIISNHALRAYYMSVIELGARYVVRN